MKKKRSKLDKIDLAVNPRPMTTAEKKALESYIANDKEKNKKRKKAA